MSANLVARLGVATCSLLALLNSSGTEAAGTSTATPVPGIEARAALPWAGNITFERTALTRIPHGGVLRPLSRPTLARVAAESFSPDVPTSYPPDGEWSLIAGSGQGGGGGPARIGHSAIYDPGRDRMVVFGGFTNDTWVLDMTVPQADWQPLDTEGDLPPNRAFHTAVYDANSDRMVVYAGYDWSLLSDVWELDFTTSPPHLDRTPTPWIDSDAACRPRGGLRLGSRSDDRLRRYDGSSGPTERRKDVWSLSLGGSPEWTELTPAVDGPSARAPAMKRSTTACARRW